MIPTVKFAKITPNAIIPEYAHDGDSGFDFYTIEQGYVEFGMIEIVRTGLRVEMPFLGNTAGLGNQMPYQVTMELQLRAKSGLAAKQGISLVNGIGTIDFGYRGEIMIALTRVIPGCIRFEPGQKIAQGVFAPVFNKQSLKFLEVSEEELNDTPRGEGGFGSTGT
jgi:dUTP pyrophosphatase